MSILDAPITDEQADQLFQQYNRNMPPQYAPDGNIIDMPTRPSHGGIVDRTIPGDTRMVMQVPRTPGHYHG